LWVPCSLTYGLVVGKQGTHMGCPYGKQLSFISWALDSQASIH
jgi:hypothetical protein